ncbi:unnamed protein product, partial [marine sediment metagenome]
ERLSMDDRKMWCRIAVNIINKAFRYDEYDLSTRSSCAVLLPHAVTAVDHAEELKIVTGEIGKLLNETGLYLTGIADLKGAGEK